MPEYFLFGTLCHPPLLQAVLGCADVTARPASLPGHAVHWVRGANWPVMLPRAGSQTEGLLLAVDAEGAARLDLYERAFGYSPARVVVQQRAGGETAALAYMPPPGSTPGAPWSLADWVGRWGAVCVATVPEVMRLAASGATPEAMWARYPMLLARSASRLRAQHDPAPARLRRKPGPDDVATLALDVPYENFFAVEEAGLRFRRFDGRMSQPVLRASFIMGDAVTVLPYDPRRDTVLLVEQFRAGPHARGDTNPWSLEPVAGRIDAGESPEAAARRETLEEARLELHALEPVAGYYPSPGAVTEYLYSYVALADLTLDAATLAGLEGEDEDIRSHVLPFAALMELVESGEAQNGPLILSALWLARNRERLRAGAGVV